MKLPMAVFGEDDRLPPVVLVHGLFGQGKNLAPIARGLAQSGRKAITLDLRNHGRAPKSDEHSYPLMAADIYESLVDYAQIDLCGHSMGGKAAMRLALDYPQFVRKLVVADMAPKNYDHSYDEIIAAVIALDLSRLQTRQDANLALQSAIPDENMRQFILHSLQFSPEPYWLINFQALQKAMPEILRWEAGGEKFENPTLFLSGADSDYVQASDRAMIKAIFPNAHFAKIKNAGHWLHVDQQKAFIHSLVSFFV